MTASRVARVGTRGFTFLTVALALAGAVAAKASARPTPPASSVLVSSSPRSETYREPDGRLLTYTYAKPRQGTSVNGAQPRTANSEACSQFEPETASEMNMTQCGAKSYTRESVTSMPHGGTESHYKVGPGSVTFFTPPASFNAATASNAELTEYGIPLAPPTTSSEYPMWQQMIKNLHFGSPPTSLIDATAMTASTTAKPSGNWSGYADQANYQRYTQATGYFYPPASPKQSCTGATMAMWSGLGGLNSGSLSQDGFNVAAGGKHYPAWWEILPRGETFIKGYWASPGAYFLAQTKYEGKEKRHFYMYNYATGVPQSFSGSGASENDQSTADYIAAERVSINKSLTPLMEFGTVEGQGYTSATAGDEALENFPNYFIEMKNGTSTLARPGGLTEGAKFKDTWVKCV